MKFIVEEWDATLRNDQYMHLHNVIAAEKEGLLKWYAHMDDSEMHIVWF
jgi:hypothetical protein